ncbi:MAG TPA: nucleotidyltransferase family protein [Tepidisphaeraceae bacterium]|nr:nucleotidyltransferase family protein [Tepidisphaeraceae bacterium]
MKPAARSIAAVVLAAGRSARMGRCKALLNIGGKPMIRHILDSLAQADIDQRMVITGHDADLVRSAIGDAKVAHNPGYANGMISSVKVGVAAMRDNCDAMFIVLGDHPLIQVDTFRQLIERWTAHSDEIIQPRYDGKPGHPVIIPVAYADSILALPPNATLKTWIQTKADRIQFVDVDDPGIRMDVDTAEDYQRAVDLFSTRV